MHVTEEWSSPKNGGDPSRPPHIYMKKCIRNTIHCDFSGTPTSRPLLLPLPRQALQTNTCTGCRTSAHTHTECGANVGKCIGSPSLGKATHRLCHEHDFGQVRSRIGGYSSHLLFLQNHTHTHTYTNSHFHMRAHSYAFTQCANYMHIVTYMHMHMHVQKFTSTFHACIFTHENSNMHIVWR